MDRPRENRTGKLIFGLVSLLVLMGLGMLVAWTGVNDMPAHDQASAWRWFIAGWVFVTVGCWLAYLPRWLRNAVVTREEQQLTPLMMRLGRIIGRLIVVIASALGIMGSSMGIGLGAAMLGMLSWLLSLVAMMLFTKKGRAIRARQLEVNRGL